MICRGLVLTLTLFACGGARRENRMVPDTLAVETLVGAWDAQLSLKRPYQLGLSDPVARRICGTMGFVENHYATADATDGAPSVGVYDLDLSRLGLDWLNTTAFPTAVASDAGDVRARVNERSGDSVTIILNPGSSERIVLLGRYNAAGIDGDWVAQSVRGTASGAFSLRPHGPSPDPRPSC